MHAIRPTAALFVLLFGVHEAPVRATERPAVTAFSRAVGVTLPIYSTNSPKPSAIIRVAGFRKDYVRKGFFRIGALPVWVAENVILEIHDPSAIPNLLTSVDALLRKDHDGAGWEIRNFSIQGVVRSNATVLTAAIVRPISQTRWDLSEVRVAQNAGELQLRRARLNLSGARAGWLEFTPMSGISAINLLAANQ